MTDKTNEKILTIIIPQYRTRDLTKLCLRMIRDHVDLKTTDVLVIDNGSGDDSLDYLKSVPWIRLMERPKIEGEPPAEQHARSLDMALEAVSTPFVMTIHTDTFFLDGEGIPYMLRELCKDDRIAGVGSWKLEQHPPVKRFFKKIEDAFQLFVLSPLRGHGFGRRRPELRNHHYLRSHCALYRTELLKTRTHGFWNGETAGKSLHHELEAQGFKMVFLPVEEQIRHIVHLDHATAVLNPDRAGAKSRKPKAMRRLKRALEKLRYREILAQERPDC